MGRPKKPPGTTEGLILQEVQESRPREEPAQCIVGRLEARPAPSTVHVACAHAQFEDPGPFRSSLSSERFPGEGCAKLWLLPPLLRRTAGVYSVLRVILETGALLLLGVGLPLYFQT